jgi:uncharacterized repeat protein (TIGR01451 family)
MSEKRDRRRRAAGGFITCRCISLLLVLPLLILSIVLPIVLSSHHVLMATQTHTLFLGSDNVLNGGDVIQIETLITNTGNETLRDVNVTDSLPIGTMCVPADMNGTVLTIQPGQTIRCAGMYTVMQSDIGSLFETSTVIGSPNTTDLVVSAKTNLGENKEPILVLTQMAHINRGEDDFLNAGDVLEVTVKGINVGSDTISNLQSTNFNGTWIAQMMPMQMQNFTYNYVLTQEDVDRGEIVLVETASGIGAFSGTPVAEANALLVDLSRPEEVRVRMQTVVTQSTSSCVNT